MSVVPHRSLLVLSVYFGCASMDQWERLASEPPLSCSPPQSSPPQLGSEEQWEQLAGEGPLQWSDLANDSSSAEDDVQHRGGEVGGIAAAEPVLQVDPSPVQLHRRRGRRPKHHQYIPAASAGVLCESLCDIATPGNAASIALVPVGMVPSAELLPHADDPAHVGQDCIALSSLDVQRLSRQTDGIFLQSPCLPYVGSWMDAAFRAELRGRADDDTTKVAQLLHGMPTHHAFSTTSICEATGVSRKAVATREHRLASSMLLASQAEQSFVEQGLVQATTGPSGMQLHMFIEVCRFDETPMHVRARPERCGSVDHQPPVPALSDLIGEHISIPGGFGSTGVQPQGFRPVASTHNILHVEFSCAYLVSLPSTGGEGRRYIMLVKRSPRRLFILDRTTAECLLAALRRACPTTRGALSFEMKCRLVCTDKASSNDKAEHAFGAERRAFGFTPPCIMHCELHIAATISTRTFINMEGDITGIIRMALSLQMGAYMHRFRMILRGIVYSRVKICIGVPPAEAMKHRARVLQVFGGSGRQVVQTLIALHMLPNGDWRDSEYICIFVSPAIRGASEDERLKQLVVFGIEHVMTSSRLPLYSRARWTGFDLSLDWLGKLSLCHNLLRETYQKFVATFGPSGAGQPHDAAVTIQPGDCEFQAGPTGVDAGLGPADSSAAPSTWQAENDHSRREGLRFVTGPMEVSLILMRLVFEPLRCLMASKLKVSGDVFEAEQREAERVSLMTEGSDAQPRKYRVLLSAMNVAEYHAQDKLSVLMFSQEMWSLLPESAFTLKVLGMAFRCCSRLGALLEELLIDPHRRYPFRLFTALVGDAEASQVMGDPYCSRCTLSKSFLQSTDLCSELGKAKLVTLAKLCNTDTGPVECSHASLRRFVKTIGLQTHTPDMPLVASRWMASKWRKEQNDPGVFRWQPQCRQTPTVPACDLPGSSDRPRKKFRGGGGSWRAHVRSETMGQPGRPNLAEMAHSYRLQTEVARERLTELGEAGTRAHRSDPAGSSFGGSSRVMQRALNWIPAEAAHHQLALVATTPQGIEKWCELTPQTVGCVPGVLSETLRHSKAKSRDVAAQCRTRTNELQLYAEGGLQHLAQDLEEALMIPERWTMAMKCCPSQEFPVLEFRSGADSLSERLVSWTYSSGTVGVGTDAKHLASSVGKILEEGWRNQLDSVPHDDSSPIDSSKLPKPTKCSEAGRCVCSRTGARLAAFRTKFLQGLKYLFPRRSPDLVASLKAGHIVVVVAGLAPNRLEEACHDPVYLLGPEEVQFVWHIAMMYLSPWRPTLQCLQMISTDPTRKVHQVEAIGKWQTLWAAVEACDQDLAWGMRVFSLLETAGPVVEFIPARVTMSPMHGPAGELLMFWWPHRGGGARRHRMEPLAVLDAVVLDDNEGVGPDDDAEVEAEFLHLLEEALGEGFVHEEPAVDGEEEGGGAPVDGLHDFGLDEAVTEPVDVGSLPPALDPEARRGHATASVTFPFQGSISFYENKAIFQATCFAPGHRDGGRCVKTRTSQAGASRPQQGRPLGYLVAWLWQQNAFPDRQGHFDCDSRRGTELSNAERLVARSCARAEYPDFATLESHERPLRVGEAEEPELCP